MNPIDRFRIATFHDAEVTWVGPDPFRRGLCLGFDNGTLVFTDFASYESKPQEFSRSKEAINGVASIGSTSLAVSTRSDVTFVEVIAPQNAPSVVFEGGAHSVVATKSGYFIAPRGADGILLVKPDREPEQKMRVTSGWGGKPLYFYRMTALHDGSGRETLVFANRTGGVGLSHFKGGEDRRGVHTLGYDGLDVIDVCGVSEGSLSALAISPAGEILWIRDASTHDDPIATKLTGIEGKVYRVLATPRTLFVLSSKNLYVWRDLVEQVLSQKSSTLRLQPLVIPVEAIDMSLINDHLFLVLAENGVAGIPIEELESGRDLLANRSSPNGSFRRVTKFSTFASQAGLTEIVGLDMVPRAAALV